MKGENDNLIKLLKLFKNRPYHLAKYLIENSALNNDFIDKLKKSKISEIEIDNFNFLSIDEMNTFYSSLTDIKDIENKNRKEIQIELNDRLNNAINNEDYEEAARIRDYMSMRKIKRIKKN